MTPDTDKFLLRRAREASLRSNDPSTKIGAVLVRPMNPRPMLPILLAEGHNGFPPGIAEDERMHDRAQKYELVVHAEMRALLGVRGSARGATLYLWGYKGPPCTNCAKHLIEAGVRRVVASGSPTPDRWKDSLDRAAAMLAEAGVETTYYDAEEVYWP